MAQYQSATILRSCATGFSVAQPTCGVGIESVFLLQLWWSATHFIEIDDGLPELVVGLVEVAHAHFSKVSGMVLVDIRAVVMLATSHTSTTGMLAVLAYTTMTGGDMATAGQTECQ